MPEDTEQNSHLYKPGQSGNPAGRPKGSRNKLGEAFLSDMQADWVKHGSKAIEKVREEKPDAYLKVVASILPRDLNVNVNKFDDMTDDQLIERLRDLHEAVSPFLPDAGDGGVDGGTAEATKH